MVFSLPMSISSYSASFFECSVSTYVEWHGDRRVGKKEKLHTASYKVSFISGILGLPILRPCFILNFLRWKSFYFNQTFMKIFVSFCFWLLLEEEVLCNHFDILLSSHVSMHTAYKENRPSQTFVLRKKGPSQETIGVFFQKLIERIIKSECLLCFQSYTAWIVLYAWLSNHYRF